MESEKNSDIFGYKVVLLETIAKEKSNINSNKYQVSGIKRNFEDLMFQKLN